MSENIYEPSYSGSSNSTGSSVGSECKGASIAENVSCSIGRTTGTTDYTGTPVHVSDTIHVGETFNNLDTNSHKICMGHLFEKNNETTKNSTAKEFLLATDILKFNPSAILDFEENNINISMTTIEELKKLSEGRGEISTNAREAISLIKKYYNDENGVLPDGGEIHIIPEIEDVSGPNVYIQICQRKRPLILVTNDESLHIRAAQSKIKAETYTHAEIKPEKPYFGRREVFMSPENIALLYSAPIEVGTDKLYVDENDNEDLIENEFLVVHNAVNIKQTVLAQYRNGYIVPVANHHSSYKVKAKNAGQSFALEALFAPVDKIPLVILQGPAGTGKTFLALAAALEQTINEGDYKNILVTRPNIKFDEDIGYIKGSEAEKIEPLMRPITDNLKSLWRKRNNYDNDKYAEGGIQSLFDQEIVQAQAMAYMRGRSITDTFIIIDEAQNMNPKQAFGIISRVGSGTKIVLAGDPTQIDNPIVNQKNNGLTYAAEKMKNSPYCAQVYFTEDECVRSPLSLEAVSRMKF